MRCGFFTIFIVCHVNLVLVLFGACAEDAIINDADSNSKSPNHIDASAAEAAASLVADEATDASPPPTELFDDTSSNFDKLPTILIVTLFRNKAHTMPLFFTFLNRLEYPKKRISLW